MVRSSEVHRDAGCLLEPLVAVELGAIVERQREGATRCALDETDGAAVRLADRALAQLADPDVAGLAIHQREDAVLVGAANHRVTLEMADAGSVLRSRRPLGDRTLAGQASATVIAPVALAQLFRIVPQVGVQRAT